MSDATPSPSTSPTGTSTPGPAEKVRTFPATPGVYLMKDAQGRVIYVGKAKNLRTRAGSYFQKASESDKRIADWIGEVVDIDFLAADSEVDALLLEARLDQGHPAQAQRRPQRRQVVPLSPDHHG